MERAAFWTVLVALAALAAPAAGDDRPIGDTVVFARVGRPGMPEGIVVDGARVLVGTHTSVRGNSGEGPSKIFTYDLDTASLSGELAIAGQNLGATHGILGMAFDGDGRLYVLDRNPPRMIRIDPTSQTTYATFPDLPRCAPNLPIECSPTTLDQAPYPDYFAFDAAGNAYVTDLEQATIFRVPPGGGPAEVWFADPRLDSIFGPNGIAVDPTGTKLYFAMTGSTQPGSPTLGLVYTLPLQAQRPRAEDLETFFTYAEPATGPDGIAFGASGRLYVALAGSNQLSILSADAYGAGREVVRFPSAEENAQHSLCELTVCTPEDQVTPYDLPASIAFDGRGSILLTNQSFFAAEPQHWVVFDVWVDDTALELIRPEIP